MKQKSNNTMLEKNKIPDTEPNIRVGIILPEDKFTEITINIPKNFPFVASSEHGEQISHAKELTFSLSNGTILLNSTISGNIWLLKTNQANDIHPKSGFVVKNVIAGRGFHWQKQIDVFLPGNIEITQHNGHLILINELPLEQYLMCVATSEMGAKCPKALIEAQTIVARSWMLANVEQKHINLGMDVCNDDCCQRYQGSGNLTQHSISGALETSGEVLIYQAKICDARYSKSCGGIMESFATIWDGKELDYLQNLPDISSEKADLYPKISDQKSAIAWIDDNPEAYCSPDTVKEETLSQYLGNVDEDGKYYRWQIEYSQDELCQLLNDRLSINAGYISELKPISRGGSGRIIDLQIKYEDTDGQVASITVNRDVAIRQALHKGFLYSSCIYFEYKKNKQNKITTFIIHGAGWGHGVGLCQIGALGMSLNDYSSAQIVAHYYPGSRLVRIY
jgi:stage II sporulation protein D